MNIGDTLTQKIGPFPGYVWVGAGAGVIVLLGVLFRGGGSSSSSPPQDAPVDAPAELPTFDPGGGGGAGGEAPFPPDAIIDTGYGDGAWGPWDYPGVDTGSDGGSSGTTTTVVQPPAIDTRRSPYIALAGTDPARTIRTSSAVSRTLATDPAVNRATLAGAVNTYLHPQGAPQDNPQTILHLPELPVPQNVPAVIKTALPTLAQTRLVTGRLQRADAGLGG